MIPDDDAEHETCDRCGRHTGELDDVPLCYCDGPPWLKVGDGPAQE